MITGGTLSSERWMRKGGILTLLMVATAGVTSAIPLPDLVVYGRVHDPDGVLQTGATVPPVVLVGRSPSGGDVFRAELPILLDPGSGELELYALRAKRFSAGTARGEDDRFLLPGDRLHLFVDWNNNGVTEASEEATETKETIILATASMRDLRYLDLNDLSLDADDDGLPDSWERRYFGDLGQAGPDRGIDGVDHALALALGLDPRRANQSRMPFLAIEAEGDLAYYFRQATTSTGGSLEVESSETGEAGSWMAVDGLAPEEIGIEGESRLLRVVVPPGAAGGATFYRLRAR